MYRKTLAITSFILCISALIIAAKGYNPAYTVDAVAGSTPNIDGVIASGEWDDASTVSFNNTVVYVKQDGINLYVAFNVSDNTVNVDPGGGPQDMVAIGVDVLNDGGASPQTDDVFFYILRSGLLREAQGSNPPAPPTGGWNGSASSTSSHWQAEFNITYAKIQIVSGQPKTLGIAFMSLDYATGYPYFWPPMTPMQSNSPSNWGNLTSEVNWVPEFSTVIALPLFMILTMLVVVFAKTKAARKLKT